MILRSTSGVQYGLLLPRRSTGCDFVLGIDGRQMHIDQANFVFDARLGLRPADRVWLACPRGPLSMPLVSVLDRDPGGVVDPR